MRFFYQMTELRRTQICLGNIEQYSGAWWKFNQTGRLQPFMKGLKWLTKDVRFNKTGNSTCLPQPPKLVFLSSLTPCSQLHLPLSALCLISVLPQGFMKLLVPVWNPLLLDHHTTGSFSHSDHHSLQFTFRNKLDLTIHHD